MQPLLQRSLLLILLLIGLRALPAAATHLLGGEINYSYLDNKGPTATPYRYRVTVLVYVNAGSSSNVPTGRPSIMLAFYTKSGDPKVNGTRLLTVTVPRVSNPIITPPQPGGCGTTGASPVTVRLVRYETIVSLPLSFDGYYAVYTDGNRNAGVLNLSQSDSFTQLLYVEMAPPLIPNSSPTFSDTAVVVVCQGDTSIIVNNAVDADGDRLIYSFSRPYGVQNAPQPPQLPTTFIPPPSAVTYANGYSQTAPFGTGPGRYAFLNASTGLSAYSAALLGAYVVVVEVREYRVINGVEKLIGSTRREIQLIARTCTPNRAPQFTAATQATHLYSIEEGQTVSFNLAATDPDGNPITLKANSVLLDGPGPYNASFGGSQGTVQPSNPTGTVTITGTGGSVNGQFVFASSCGNARSTPYDIVVTATDVACGAKSVADIFQIKVNRAAAPSRINGDTVICDRSQVATYSATGPVASSYRWTAQGGTIQGSNANPTVQVRWAATGTQRIAVRGISALGCPTDSIFRNVDVRPVSALAVTPTSAAICVGGSTTLTASGGQRYTWTGGNQTFTGASITVAPTQTTTYTVTSTDGICTATRQVTVVVNPVAVADAGPDVNLCSGKTAPLGSAALAGYTYAWSPATGLSNPNVANPVFSATNTTGTAQQFTYTLTATSPQGCVATDAVTVTLNEAAVAQAGPDPQPFCSGGTASLGVAGTAPAGVTYLWSPATGLSSPTAPATTVTLTNTGTTILTNRYILRATTAQGCTATDTVDVTVYPAAVATAGTDRALCSGETTVLGATALTGYTYSWSPGTGLSSITAANPTFSLVNNGTTPQLYIFVVTAATAQGCTATATVRVTVNPAAVANAGADVALCPGATATLGTPALAGYSYAWSPAANLSSASTARPVVTGLNTTQTPITTTYTVTATTAEGCSATDVVLVTVNPNPLTDSIAGTRSVCPTVRGVVYSIKNAHSTTYQWTVVDGTIVSGQGTASIAVNWNGPNLNASVTAYALNATQCRSDAFTLPVRINQLLQTARPTGPTNVCQANGPYTYQTVLTAGSTYAWNIIGGTQVASSGNTVVVNWTRPGIGKIAVFETTDPAGGRCISQTPLDTLFVNVLPSPSATLAISGPSRACVNAGAIRFTLPGAAASTYAYTLNGAAISGSSSTVSLPTPTTPGTYTLTAVEKNTSLCSGPVYTKQFTVVPALVINGPANYCPESRTGLTYTLGAAASALQNANYQWSVAGGTVVSGQGTGTVTLSFPAGTTPAALQVSDVNSAGCAATFTIRPDNATVALQAASVVPGDRSITLQLNVPNNSGNGNQVRILRRVSGSGAFAAVGTAANTATSFTDPSVDADASSYDYRIELQNSCGTVLQSQDHTTIRTVATATEGQAGRDEGKVKVLWNAYLGFPVKEYQLFRTAGNGTPQLVTTVSGTTLQTEFATGAAGFDQCIRVVAVSSTAASITAASNDACVTFANDLVFYNVITPNSDGLNDMFEIKNIGLYPGNTLSIVNRWGKEVYSASNYDNKWDGQGQSSGMYYYLCKLPGGKSYKGWFEIMK